MLASPPLNGQAQPTSPAVVSSNRTALSAKSQSILASTTPNGVNGVGVSVSGVNGHHGPKHHHIWLVTGPAGCGKTTVAQHLAQALQMPYIEGDAVCTRCFPFPVAAGPNCVTRTNTGSQFHPEANIAKMSNGIPLTDEDRWDWLTKLREEALDQLAKSRGGVVLTCSALKRKYRDVLRVAGYFDHSLRMHIIYLDASENELLRRVQARQNHYMGANMVHSQFDILEPPHADETDVIRINVSRTVDEVKQDALARVLAILEQPDA